MESIAGETPCVNPPKSPSRKFSLTVKIEPDGQTMRLDGRVAWAMKQLIDAGNRGCTPITHPGPRWSDYIFKARALGFVIETEHESHGGQFPGHHARYRLHTTVSVLEDMAAAA